MNAPDGKGRTPLHMAVFATRTANGKLLLEAGADPALKTDAGRDALSLARKVRAEEALPPVVVYAPSLCLACIDWTDHLRQNGFEVSIEETPIANMPKLKRWLNVPAELESVHTAQVGRYFVEGHVPAEDIKLLVGPDGKTSVFARH